MNVKVAQWIILLFVCAGVFFAFYLRKPPVENIIPKEVKTEGKEEKKITPPPERTQPTFTLSVDSKASINIGILGESWGDENQDQGFNSVVLTELLEALKAQQTQVIFFSGNLVSGVEKGPKETTQKINAQKLAEQLQKFVSLYQSILGDAVPFYPAIGDRELAIPGAAAAFTKEFHLYGSKVIGAELCYTVSIGSAFFAVIATEELAAGSKGINNTFSPGLLEWLKKVLAGASQSHRFLFVIGHEPAFPSTTTYTDKNVGQRDAFWKILVDNGVLAYFSSREHLFDRSNRSGVWQVISGGGGAPLSQGGGTNPFFHCLLMTIPPGKEAMPKVQVYDILGKVVDEFDLKSTQEPIYQMRISNLHHHRQKIQLTP